jgi:hypothetical protein
MLFTLRVFSALNTIMHREPPFLGKFTDLEAKIAKLNRDHPLAFRISADIVLSPTEEVVKFIEDFARAQD